MKIKKPSNINVMKPSGSRFNDEKGKEIKALATVNLAKIKLVGLSNKTISTQRDVVSITSRPKDIGRLSKLDFTPYSSHTPSSGTNKLNSGNVTLKKTLSEVKSATNLKKS